MSPRFTGKIRSSVALAWAFSFSSSVSRQRRDLFHCRLAAQQQHLVLRCRQLVVGEIEQPPLHTRIKLEQGIELGPCKPAQHHIADGFGAVRITLARRQPQKIPGIEEASDLASAVGEQLVKLDRTSRDIEHVVGRLALVKQHLLVAEVDMTGNRADPAYFLVAQRGAKGQVAHGAGSAIECAAGARLPDWNGLRQSGHRSSARFLTASRSRTGEGLQASS
jgi:hypothetical protein